MDTGAEVRIFQRSKPYLKEVAMRRKPDSADSVPNGDMLSQEAWQLGGGWNPRLGRWQGAQAPHQVGGSDRATLHP